MKINETLFTISILQDFCFSLSLGAWLIVSVKVSAKLENARLGFRSQRQVDESSV